MSAFVHGRVNARHPELSEHDVLVAWKSRIAWAIRLTDARNQVAAVGFDDKGRFIEMIAVCDGDDYLIFHAMTPPSKRTLTELDLLGRKR